MAPKTQKQNEATWIFAAKRILPKQNKTKQKSLSLTN